MDESWITGIIAVKAAVMAGNRAVKTVLLDTEKRSDPGFSAFARRAGEMGHGVEWLPSQALQERAGEGCQGAAALVGPRRMKPLAELLTLPQLVLLHGVEDPYNFGHALRSLYAAGVDGVILPPRNWSTAACVVARASAGAAEWIPMAQADPYEAVTAAKARGYRFLCAEQDKQAVSLFAADLQPPLLLAVGGEKRGLNRRVRALADAYVEIPYGRDFPYALSTDGAAAVAAFELLRRGRPPSR